MNDQSEPRVAADEFMDVARDPEQARQLKKSLQQLADKVNEPILKEFAQEVLAGRVGLREAAASPAYAEALIDKAQTFRHYWESLSEAQREELADEGTRLLNGQDAPATAPGQHSDQPPKKPSRHDARGWSLY